MRMRPRVIGALVGSLAAFAVAGGGLAFAQEAPSTTEAPDATAPDTTAPDAADPGRGGGDCHHDDGGDAPAADETSL